MSTKEDVLQALLTLADEWDHDAASDEKYLNGPSIGIDEGPRLDAQIQLARMNAQELRDLVKEYS